MEILLCLEVFFARILDVSIGSVKTVYLIKQKNLIACFLAFIELLIWFYVARETLTKSDIGFSLVASYALGYAVGTYIGGIINKYLIKGNLMVLVFLNNDVDKLKSKLKKNSYGVSSIVMNDGKQLLLIEVKKRNLKRLKQIIKEEDKRAFIIINETLEVENGFI